MRHTNLIAARSAPVEPLRAAWRTAIFATLGVGAVALLVPLLLTGVWSARAERLRVVQQERLALAPAVAQQGALTLEIARLQYPAMVAVAAHTNNATWSGLLQELRDRLPAGLWLTEVAVSPATGAPQPLTLAGQAENHEAIGEFVAALTGSAWLAAAELRASAPAEGSGPPYDFAIDALLRRPLTVSGAGEARR